MVSEMMKQDHEQLWELLGDLQTALGTGNRVKAFELLDLFWARLAVHIRAEHLCLFPAILNAPPESFRKAAGVPALNEVEAAIDKLRGDHNFFMHQLSEAVKRFRPVLSQSEHPERSANTLEDIRTRVLAVAERLNAHDALEEKQVYRWPAKILSPPELERLFASLRRELENLPPRFARSL